MTLLSCAFPWQALSLPAAPPLPYQDVHNSAFALLQAQQAAAPAYLQAALAEYLASCHACCLEPAPSLAALYIDLLLDQVGRREVILGLPCCAC